MIRRDASRLILLMAKRRRILTIAGPRNSGKSSLAKMLFPRHIYLDLESPQVREFAKTRPDDFFKRVAGNVILDEYGDVPELRPYIREASRERQIVLITSRLPPARAFSLSRLSGMNAGVVVLLPLAMRELRHFWVTLERDELIHRGFMPCAYLDRFAPRRMFLDYYLLHVEGYLLSADLDGSARAAFRSFMRLLAGRVGQTINLDSLAEAAGVPRALLSMWISALEAAFVIFRLPSYPGDFWGTRVKKPKLYFTDVGFAAYLLGIKNPTQVFRDPCVGSLFENMVVADAFKTRCNMGLSANLFYYRSQDGTEIDLILQGRGGTVPMEIKSSPDYDATFANNIKRFRAFSKRNGYVIYSGNDTARMREVKFVNFRNVWTVLDG